MMARKGKTECVPPRAALDERKPALAFDIVTDMENDLACIKCLVRLVTNSLDGGPPQDGQEMNALYYAAVEMGRYASAAEAKRTQAFHLLHGSAFPKASGGAA